MTEGDVREGFLRAENNALPRKDCVQITTNCIMDQRSVCWNITTIRYSNGAYRKLEIVVDKNGDLAAESAAAMFRQLADMVKISPTS